MGELQSQVEEVKGILTQNIEKVMERGDKLDDLMDKTYELEEQVWISDNLSVLGGVLVV